MAFSTEQTEEKTDDYVSHVEYYRRVDESRHNAFLALRARYEALQHEYELKCKAYEDERNLRRMWRCKATVMEMELKALKGDTGELIPNDDALVQNMNILATTDFDDTRPSTPSLTSAATTYQASPAPRPTDSAASGSPAPIAVPAVPAPRSWATIAAAGAPPVIQMPRIKPTVGKPTPTPSLKPTSAPTILLSRNTAARKPVRPYLLLNFSHQRIDEPLPTLNPLNRDSLLAKSSALKFCNEFFLTDQGCHAGPACEYRHDGTLKAGELVVLKYFARSAPCLRGSACRQVDCAYGHVCPRTKDGRSCEKKKCKFGECHGVKTIPIYKVYEDGTTEVV